MNLTLTRVELLALLTALLAPKIPNDDQITEAYAAAETLLDYVETKTGSER